jgi:hypothetical protein
MTSLAVNACTGDGAALAPEIPGTTSQQSGTRVGIARESFKRHDQVAPPSGVVHKAAHLLSAPSSCPGERQALTGDEVMSIVRRQLSETAPKVSDLH